MQVINNILLISRIIICLKLQESLINNIFMKEYIIYVGSMRINILMFGR